MLSGREIAFGPILCLGMLAGGCAATQPADPLTAANPAAPPDWRRVATSADQERIRSWRDAFVKALGAARAAGHEAEIVREGALLNPDAALDHPRPPAGAYHCRVIKLGSQSAGVGEYTTYPDFQCRIDNEGDVASFTKVGGSQRPVGIIMDDGDRRQIFLGTMMLGDERRALDYGSDPDRDMAGAIERVGDRRWRLILPYPRFESIMDVVELVPAT